MLKDLVYYRTGGSCDELIEPQTAQELSAAIKRLKKSKIPYFIIGGGTNSLVSDQHWPGAVIAFTKMARITVDPDQHELFVEAGVENTSLAQRALQLSWTGIAWMNRLPGQLGGTVRMNARCYGGEISQVVSEVEVVTKDGDIHVYKNDGSIFSGYKDTIFMTNSDIITGAKLRLSAGDSQQIKSTMDHCESDRIAKGQFTFPSCGCVFKNDYDAGAPSGMLLDRANAHQLNKKNVALNPKHANFVFNKGCGSDDIIAMTLAMRELVYQKFGVWLSYEMEILGKVSPEMEQRIKEVRPPNYNADLEDIRAEFRQKLSRK